MANASNDWFEQIKYYIHRAVDQNLSVLEGTVTSRQLNPPSVKVMLQPHGIETGWLRIGTPYGGNGFGFLAIPQEEQAVKVIFDQGDRSSAIVICDVYNDVDVPPALTAIDDVVLQHKSGAKIYFHANGDVDVQSSGKLNFNGGTAGVARIGDTVTVNVGGTNYTGTIATGSTTVRS